MAAPTTIRIELIPARDVASQLSTIRTDDIETAIVTLRQLNEELDAAWDGPASIDFKAMFEQWNVYLGHVADDLHQVGNYITSAADSYETTDNEQKHDVGRLRAETHMK